MMRHRPMRVVVGLAPCVLLEGCRHSPSVNVLGSYFPGWIACMAVGAALTALVRLLLRRLDVEHTLPWLPLFYFCVAVIFACTFWLLAFD